MVSTSLTERICSLLGFVLTGLTIPRFLQLTEAMDVLQRQVDEYENEIRALKDFKSPTKRGTPRRSVTTGPDLTLHGRASAGDMQISTGALEATLFRPALQRALNEAAHWKAVSMSSSLLDLPPLPVLQGGIGLGGENKSIDESDNSFSGIAELSSALASYRLERASVKVVDLTNREKSPRAQLRESNARLSRSAERLETVVLRCRGRLQT